VLPAVLTHDTESEGDTMAGHDKIAIGLTGQGWFEVTAFDVDRAMSFYLPAAPYELRQKIDLHDQNTFPTGHYRDLDTVFECLVVLAYLDNRTADDPDSNRTCGCGAVGIHGVDHDE
jgi:hypothetical protein